MHACWAVSHCIFGLPLWLRQPPRAIPWRRDWLSTPEFLPGEFHGQRSLVGCSPWGYKELDLINTSTLSEKWLYKMKYKILYCGFFKMHRKKYGIQKHLILLYPFHSFGSISAAEFKHPIISNYICIQ